jgi:hypothetical protein
LRGGAIATKLHIAAWIALAPLLGQTQDTFRPLSLSGRVVLERMFTSKLLN